MATERRRNRDRRSISSVRPRSYSDLYKSDDTAQVNTMAAVAGSAPGKSSDVVDWQSEYGYVVSDLRRLLIVSGLLFAAIIVAGFFI